MPTLTFKVSPAEARKIRAQARKQKATVSAYLRKLALPEAPEPERTIIMKIHPVSGLPYDAAPGRPVTQAEIDAALVDFP
jgi:hypothetical protein